MGGALARPSWLSSPTLGRANRFLSTAAVSIMTPRRPLAPPEKVKIRTLAVEQRTEEDSESWSQIHIYIEMIQSFRFTSRFGFMDSDSHLDSDQIQFVMSV